MQQPTITITKIKCQQKSNKLEAEAVSWKEKPNCQPRYVCSATSYSTLAHYQILIYTFCKSRRLIVITHTKAKSDLSFHI